MLSILTKEICYAVLDVQMFIKILLYFSQICDIPERLWKTMKSSQPGMNLVDILIFL